MLVCLTVNTQCLFPLIVEMPIDDGGFGGGYHDFGGDGYGGDGFGDDGFGDDGHGNSSTFLF